jgi:hypothetical protein
MLELLEFRIEPAAFLVTSLADAGAGSLRDAIRDADDHPGADLIIFKSGLTGIIGSVIAQNDARLTGGGIAAISPLELHATRIFGNSADIAGGITAGSSLTLNYSSVSGNFANHVGGILSIEPVLLNDSKVAGNFSPDGVQIAQG